MRGLWKEQFPPICRHQGLVRAGKWKLGNWLQQLIWVGLVGRETKRSHPCGGIEASFLGGGMQLNCLIPKNLHSLALRANMGSSCWLLTTPEFQQEIHISLPPWFFIAQDMHDCFESLRVILLLQIWTHFRLTQVLCSWMPESCQVLATLSTVKKRPSGKPEVEQV